MKGRAFHTARVPLSAFRTKATAYVNYIGGQFWTRIITDEDRPWYVEPPPSESQMEAIHMVKVWAGQQFDVDVVLDLDNHSFQQIGQNEREKQLHGQH